MSQLLQCHQYNGEILDICKHFQHTQHPHETTSHYSALKRESYSSSCLSMQHIDEFNTWQWKKATKGQHFRSIRERFVRCFLLIQYNNNVVSKKNTKNWFQSPKYYQKQNQSLFVFLWVGNLQLKSQWTTTKWIPIFALPFWVLSFPPSVLLPSFWSNMLWALKAKLIWKRSLQALL